MTYVCRSMTLILAGLLAASAGCASGGGNVDTGAHHGIDSGPHDGGPDSNVDANLDADLDGGPKPDAGHDAGPVDTGPVCIDMDHDGFGAACASGPDCNDMNANVSPAGTEVCNGLDDNCNGTIDEGLDTQVFCGVGACRTSVAQCSGGTTHTCTPLAAGTEVCNGIDDNCNGTTDEGFGGMTCGIGACQVTVAACSGGVPPACVPGTPTPEVCNGLDDNCNTAIDDGLGTISCGRGACLRSVPACSAGVPGTCVPGMPGSESCNGIDDNCDGVIDDGFGALSCGTGACARTAASCVGGVPMSCTPGTPSAEVCNGIDDDCNGTVDNGFGSISCGVGACLRSTAACVSGVPGTCTPGSPAASETCMNGIDDNCNGSIDEGCVTCTPPGNTVCGSASPYAIGSTVMGDNTCSSPDIAATCGNLGAGNDSTYSFVSDGSPTRYTITMTGPSGYDTVLHAHISTTCNASDEIACNDDFGTVNVSQLIVDNPPQGTVYLVADSFNTTTGSTYTLTSSTSVLNNDTCGSPIAIRANGVYTGTTIGRGNEVNPPAGTFTCNLTSNAPDVFYSITARSNGTITASTCGSGWDTEVYVGTTCGGYTVACNDDFCGVQSTVSWAATAGTTYYIGVDGYSANSGAYTLTISGY